MTPSRVCTRSDGLGSNQVKLIGIRRRLYSRERLQRSERIEDRKSETFCEICKLFRVVSRNLIFSRSFCFMIWPPETTENHAMGSEKFSFFEDKINNSNIELKMK